MDTTFEFEGLVEEPPAKVKKPRAGRWDAFLAAAIKALDEEDFGTWASWKMADEKAAESAERAAKAADPAPGVLFETRVYLAKDGGYRLALRYVNGQRKKRADATSAAEAA